MRRQRLQQLIHKWDEKRSAQTVELSDRIICRILQRVRSGKSANWPGLGLFRPGRTTRIEFDCEKESPASPARRR